MSAKQELVVLAALSALVSVVAWVTDYVFASFIFAWMTCGVVLLLGALGKFGDDAYGS
jgi:hypothetical protein